MSLGYITNRTGRAIGREILRRHDLIMNQIKKFKWRQCRDLPVCPKTMGFDRNLSEYNWLIGWQIKRVGNEKMQMMNLSIMKWFDSQMAIIDRSALEIDTSF